MSTNNLAVLVVLVIVNGSNTKYADKRIICSQKPRLN